MGGMERMGTGEKKIGILIVAYNAASTLAAVLDRIPPDFRPRISEVIVSDDHSQDATYWWVSAISRRRTFRSR